MNDVFTITLFSNANDNIVDQLDTKQKTIECGWLELVDFFLKHKQSEDKNSTAYIIGRWKTYAEGAKPSTRRLFDADGIPCGSETIAGSVSRTKHNLLSSQTITLDYDGAGADAGSIEVVREQLARYRHIGYTSHSHGKETKPGDCFRVIIPLDGEYTPEDIEQRTNNLLALFPGVDKTTFATARIFYTPAAPAERFRLAQAWHNEGLPFVLADVPADAVIERPEPIQSVRTSSPKVKSLNRSGTPRFETLDLVRFLEDQTGGRASQENPGVYSVTCPNHHAHSDGDKHAVVFQDGVKQPSFFCHHSHCQHLNKGGLFTSLYKYDDYVDYIGEFEVTQKQLRQQIILNRKLKK